MMNTSNYLPRLRDIGYLLYLAPFIGLLLLALSVKSQAQEKVNMDEFLEVAIYQGLMKDAFPTKLMDVILSGNERFFVAKCPICMPVERGFRRYSRKESRTSSRSKVPKNILRALQSEDRNTKLKAFSALTNRYTKKYLKKMKLKKSQKQALHLELMEARKTGMERKSESFGDFCPSCDGVCDMPKK